MGLYYRSSLFPWHLTDLLYVHPHHPWLVNVGHPLHKVDHSIGGQIPHVYPLANQCRCGKPCENPAYCKISVNAKHRIYVFSPHICLWLYERIPPMLYLLCPILVSPCSSFFLCWNSKFRHRRNIYKSAIFLIFSSYSGGMLPFFPCVFYPSGGPVPCRPNHRRVPRPGAELAGGAAEGHGVGGDQCPAAGGGLETWKNVTWPAGSWSK